jgi:hypothetical protein
MQPEPIAEPTSGAVPVLERHRPDARRALWLVRQILLCLALLTGAAVATKTAQVAAVPDAGCCGASR